MMTRVDRTNGGRRAGRRRRGTVLFAVLFLVVLASLSATTMLGAVAAERAVVGRELDEIELRSALRSALLVLMTELAEQRDAALGGEAPTPSREIKIDRDEGERAIVVRLIPDAEGRVLTPEAGRLDLNHATAEMLGSLPGLPASLGERIVAERERSVFQSPADVLGLEGAGELLEGEGSLGGIGDEDGGGVAAFELLTVFSFDPRVQAGVGEDDRRGNPRVNVNATWSDNMERAFEQNLSEQAAATARQLFIDAPTIEHPSDLVRHLIERGVPVEEWGVLLDSLTTSAERYRLGGVDINAAPRGVLAALPGIGEDVAADIISARERIDPANRRGVTWPLEEGIISVETFIGLVDHVVTRSLQWRVVLRAGFDDSDDGEGVGSGLLPEADEFGVEIDRDDAGGRAGPGVEVEAVIDIAGAEPRLAYLRDRSAFELVATIAAMPEFSGLDEGTGMDFEPDEMGYGADPYDEDEFDGVPMTLEDLTASFFSGEGPGFSFFDDDEFDGADLGEPVDQGSGVDAQRPSGGVSARPGDPGDNRLGRWAPVRGGGR